MLQDIKLIIHQSPALGDREGTSMQLTKPWPVIQRFYAELAAPSETEPGPLWATSMSNLVAGIIQAGYAQQLYAWTSHADLLIAPQAPDLLHFRYIDTPQQDLQWQRTVAGNDGFRSFEHFLYQLHWFEHIPLKDFL